MALSLQFPQICLPVLVCICKMIRSSEIKTSFHSYASRLFTLIIVNLVIYFESDNFTNTGQLCYKEHLHVVLADVFPWAAYAAHSHSISITTTDTHVIRLSMKSVCCTVKLIKVDYFTEILSARFSLQEIAAFIFSTLWGWHFFLFLFTISLMVGNRVFIIRMYLLVCPISRHVPF